ncbi:hypothetical protein QJS10_CPB22g00349 [Acorus calamus]|uniref:Uncharacterized protein n=1 Tax=Acorus calamus TaxID=4465 RepID=A0AAV9BZH3_ACOCL|nr:hypothetical protein QJS10_CPB22g00349 [Acorus calamus]
MATNLEAFATSSTATPTMLRGRDILLLRPWISSPHRWEAPPVITRSFRTEDRSDVASEIRRRKSWVRAERSSWRVPRGIRVTQELDPDRESRNVSDVNVNTNIYRAQTLPRRPHTRVGHEHGIDIARARVGHDSNCLHFVMDTPETRLGHG